MAINTGGFVPCLQYLWEGNDQFRCQYPQGAWQGVWVLRAGLGWRPGCRCDALGCPWL